MHLDFTQFSTATNGVVVLVCIVVVALGAHWVVEAASSLAKRLGISELVIGLTVVSLGTSAPEFAVTLVAAFKGQGNISVGNIVGSNIFNLGFILGGCALIKAIPTSRTLFLRDGSVLAGTTVLLFFLIGNDLSMDRSDGAILAILLVAYLAKLYADRGKGMEELLEEVAEADERPVWRQVVELVAGFVFIVGGSHAMVEAATVIARSMGISEWVIGVTIVAAGTSAPEFATTLVAVLRGRHDIGAGNLIGSDIFNLLGVLGLAGLIRPVEVDAMARYSLGALCGMVFLALFFVRTGWRISRLEGLVLILVASARWVFDLTSRMN